MSSPQTGTKTDAAICRTFVCDSEPCADCKNETDLETVPVVPTQWEVQRLGLASTQAEVRVPHETHTWIQQS